MKFDWQKVDEIIATLAWFVKCRVSIKLCHSFDIDPVCEVWTLFSYLASRLVKHELLLSYSLCKLKRKINASGHWADYDFAPIFLYSTQFTIQTTSYDTLFDIKIIMFQIWSNGIICHFKRREISELRFWVLSFYAVVLCKLTFELRFRLL